MTSFVPLELPDPRQWPAASPTTRQAALHARVEARLALREDAEAARADAALDAELAALLADAEGGGTALSAMMRSAPSASVYRHLWRRLAACESSALRTPGIALVLFAVPLVIVAGLEPADGSGQPPANPATPRGAHRLVFHPALDDAALREDDRAAAEASHAFSLPDALPSADLVAAPMREHGALAGNRQFGLSNALLLPAGIDLSALPRLIARARAALDAAPGAPLALDGAPIVVSGPQESVHLRFLLGTALCGPDADPLADAGVGAWGIPVSRAISAALRSGASVQAALPAAPISPAMSADARESTAPSRAADAMVLALPRAPQRLVPALATGIAAQREVALQLFASNALRRLRASVGEPVAVLSAHRAADAPWGGELRIALSSPLAPRESEGFRYALQPHERVPDAVAAIAALLDECRVADVRVASGVQADREPGTGLRRFCRPHPQGARLDH
jgi:hypothetical protein